ncbi:hypothetical protein Smp_197350 [Schistosoma mansoni]|uniref:hypothetical protein n=1 Tax=Schistosoma mansoni TaxID=6183 RepID=UPI00022DBF95|nr:hypothetical protein Smp_197350 [Schistosoma mansoni]|eukprot:XP_018651224.1 hypothetical protein Smp_197350 [Schistosoma mansoni]
MSSELDFSSVLLVIVTEVMVRAIEIILDNAFNFDIRSMHYNKTFVQPFVRQSIDYMLLIMGHCIINYSMNVVNFTSSVRFFQQMTEALELR